MEGASGDCYTIVFTVVNDAVVVERYDAVATTYYRSELFRIGFSIRTMRPTEIYFGYL